MKNLIRNTIKHSFIILMLGLGLVGGAFALEPTFVDETATTQAIGQRMAERFDQIRPLLDAGTVGFGNNGLLVIRQAPEALAQIKQVRELVRQDNQDREAVVAELVRANDKPQWKSEVRSIFARQWIARAQPGWYYQESDGRWIQK